MRRQTRLFAMVEYLRGRRTGVTAEDLAERFGVTVRTVYRDLDTLRDGELPLQADRGPGGGYALDRQYALPPVNFTAREAALLLTVGEWASRLRLLPFGESLGLGLDKVRGALSKSAQSELLSLLPRLQFTGVPALDAPKAVRAALERAFFEQSVVTIRYRGSDGVTERPVRIRSVVLERSVTLLNCDELEKGVQRQFRLDRIEQASFPKQPR